MKLIKTLTYFVILSLTFASYAEAKGRSFSGGFRSQRTVTAPRPVPQQSAPVTTTQSKSLFGSFGAKPANSGTAPQNAQSLNMSKDLNANAAQSNALKTADGRTSTTGQAAAGSANTGTGWFRSGNTANQSAQPAGAMQSAAQPVVRQGGGFLNNAMWFMLGTSMASHHQTYAPAANQNGQAVVNPDDANADGSIVALPVEEKESFFMGLLRIILWVSILSGIYWIIKNVMKSRKNRANQKPNYTFGNN